jgi:IS605 OrfB family transposase
MNMLNLNQRKDFNNKMSRVLVYKYDRIVFEDLHIQNMLQNHHPAKSISDAGWYQLMQFTKSSSANQSLYPYFILKFTPILNNLFVGKFLSSHPVLSVSSFNISSSFSQLSVETVNQMLKFEGRR